MSARRKTSRNHGKGPPSQRRRWRWPTVTALLLAPAAYYFLRPTPPPAIVATAPAVDDERVKEAIRRHFADTYDRLGHLEVDYTVRHVGEIERAQDGWYEVNVETDARHYEAEYHRGLHERLRISPDFQSIITVPTPRVFAEKERPSWLDKRREWERLQQRR